MASSSSSTSALPLLSLVECSVQPLDLSFHPTKGTVVAVACVDGTLEVHDYQSLLSTDKNSREENQGDDKSDDSDDEEDDTILSSTEVHNQWILSNNCTATNIKPKKNDNSEQQSSSTATKRRKASCRSVQFSNTGGGQHIYTGGGVGDLCCIDAETVCTFRTNTADENDSTILWRIDNATSVTASSSASSHKNNPLHTLYQLPSTCSKGPLIVSGDENGGVRLWDERLCNIQNDAVTKNSNNINSSNKSPLQLPRGCVLSWKECYDYISSFDSMNDGSTLLSTSADGTLTIYDIRNASTSNILQNSNTSKLASNNSKSKANNKSIVRQSDPQDDELLSLTIMKDSKKIVAGTHEGALAIWSYNVWGDISDRYPIPQCGTGGIGSLLKINDDMLLTGCSNGYIKVVSIHPNKVVGILGGGSSNSGEDNHLNHYGFPIESMKWNASEKYFGSISHDNYIRLWDATILKDDDDDDDDDSHDSSGGDDDDDDSDNNQKQRAVATTSNTVGPTAIPDRKRKATQSVSAAASKTLSTTILRPSGIASDDEWEDMDEDDEDEDEEDDDKAEEDGDKDSVDVDDDDDSDSDSDSDDDKQSKSKKGPGRFKSKNEEFFADL